MGKDAVKRRRMSEAQMWLEDYMQERYPYAKVSCEHQFCRRKWRFDVAVEEDHYQIHRQWGFEIEGGLYVSGAHVRGQHYESDMEKYNTAAALGWLVFRWTPKQVLNGTAKEFIERYL